MKKKKEQQYRVSDFENAIKKSDLNIQVSIINYLLILTLRFPHYVLPDKY